MTNEIEDRITQLENAIADYIAEVRIDRIESRIERKERRIEQQEEHQKQKELRELTIQLTAAVVGLIALQKRDYSESGNCENMNVPD